MTYIYEEITDDFGQKVIKRTDEDGLIAWIPMVAGNADYEAYFNKDKPQVEQAALVTELVDPALLEKPKK